MNNLISVLRLGIADVRILKDFTFNYLWGVLFYCCLYASFILIEKKIARDPPSKLRYNGSRTCKDFSGSSWGQDITKLHG